MFHDGSNPVYVEITANGKTYPRQRFLATPYALRVPTDPSTLTYDSDGNLTLSLTSQPQDGQFITRDAAGNLAWGSPSASAKQLNNRAISDVIPVSGQTLVYDGIKWSPQAQSGGVSSVTATPPLAVINGSTMPALSIATASSVSAGVISAADFISFHNAVSKSGDTMSGALLLPADGLSAGTSQLVLSNGNVGIGTATTVSALTVNGTQSVLNSSSTNYYVDAGATAMGGVGPASNAHPDFALASLVNGNWLRIGANNAKIMFYIDGNVGNNNSGQVTIDDDGYFGIGTTSPSKGLEVQAGDGNDTSLRVKNTGYHGGDFSLGAMGPASGYEYAFSLFDNNAGAFRLMVDGQGNIGIGTDAPAAKLTINAPMSGGIGPTLQLNNDLGTLGTAMAIDFTELNNWTQTVGARIEGYDDAVGGLHLLFFTKTGQNNPIVERLRITSDGKIGIGTNNPTHTLEVVGTAANTAGGSWVTLSDRRLKTIEGDYEYGLAEVNKLHTIRFRYKEGNPLSLPTAPEHTGFIAQEVQKVIPDAVIERPDGYLELNVDPIHWATVNAVHELSLENDRLKARVDQAEAKVARLEAALCQHFPGDAACAQ